MINIVSIVGASGFIGREVVDYFIENKIIVKILIDSQSKLLNFKKSDYIICYEKSPFEEDIPIEFFESDALINCFGSINGISSIYRNNILVPQNLIQQGFKKINKYIQISSWENLITFLRKDGELGMRQAGMYTLILPLPKWMPSPFPFKMKK